MYPWSLKFEQIGINGKLWVAIPTSACHWWWIWWLNYSSRGEVGASEVYCTCVSLRVVSWEVVNLAAGDVLCIASTPLSGGGHTPCTNETRSGDCILIPTEDLLGAWQIAPDKALQWTKLPTQRSSCRAAVWLGDKSSVEGWGCMISEILLVTFWKCQTDENLYATSSASITTF